MGVAQNSPPCKREQAGCLIWTISESEVKMGVVDANALAERAESSQRAKKRKLEELLARRDRLEKQIEGGFRYGFRTIDTISTGWDEF